MEMASAPEEEFKEPQFRMDQIKKQSAKDISIGLKPTSISMLTNEILKDVLSRPDDAFDPNNPKLKPKHPKIGRTAYKLDVYKKKTDVRI